MFLLTTEYPSGQIIEFNLQTAREKSHKDINDIFEKLEFKENLCSGKIFQRWDNYDLWHFDSEDAVARFVTDKQYELLQGWNKEALIPTDRQLAELELIGATSSSPYSMYADALTYPCKVETIDSQKIDLCLIVFTASPPLQRHYKNVLLLSQIGKIYPSELALPKELRRASTQVDEIRMAFAPFMVETDKREIITYDGVTHFASTGQIKGSEIRREIPFMYSKFDKISNVSFDSITFIIGKWDSRLEKIFHQTRNEQERKAPDNNQAKISGTGFLTIMWNKLTGRNTTNHNS